MEGRRNWIGWANWVAMLFCVYMVLSSREFASAASLNPRQIGACPLTQSVTASMTYYMLTNNTADDPNDSDTPISQTDIPHTAPVPFAATEPSNNSTTASNGTVKGSPISSAAAVATTASSPLNSTNDPNMCHKTHTTDPEGAIYIANPFCKPYDGQEVYPNIEYQVTWDFSLFEDGAQNTVQVYNVDAAGLTSPTTADILTSLTAINYQGTVYLNMSTLWLNNQSTANLTLSLVVDQPGSSESKVFAGPTFTLLSTSSSADDSTQPEPSSSTPSKDKKLGEKVGLPIGLVLLIVLASAVALFLCCRKRRNKGYATGKSLRQRVSSGGSGAGAGRGHRRDASFHDEPTVGGMELKDRNKGLTGEAPADNWDWNSPVSSPSAGGGGNAFRDEIQRQRGGR